MRFGVVIVLIIAIGSAIGWALPTTGSGGAEQAAGSPAVSDASAPSPHAAEASDPNAAGFSDVRRVDAPPHFAYAVVLHAIADAISRHKGEDVQATFDSMTDRSITITGTDGKGGRLEAKHSFAADGAGTRITTDVAGTGEFAAEIRDAAGGRRNRMREFNRYLDAIDTAAAEVTDRRPDMTLNQAADELIGRVNAMRSGDQAAPQYASPAAENAFAAQP